MTKLISQEGNLFLGPTMLLGATRAPLDHCFILKIFLKIFLICLLKKHEIF
jgi:hypothetical protein